jgi:AcrR family transcriptional regulator
MRNTAPRKPAREKPTRTPGALSPNKHQKKTAATRKALLEAARRMFARDGFEACRIEDIVEAAGYTRGAFYANFRTKEDLFFAIFEQEVGRRVEHLRSLLEEAGDRERKWAALRNFYVERISDRQWAMLLLEFKLFALRHPKLRPELAATHRKLRASLRLESIAKACTEPRKAALEAVLSSLALEHAYDPVRISKDEAAGLLRMLFDVLVPALPDA